MRGRVALLSIALSSGALLAQDQAPPTIRTGANLVRVDVYPSRDGVPVTDLRAEDFTVTEDGVPQVIETFEHVVVASGGPQSARIEPESIRAGRQMVADPRVRVFVIFVDTYHMDAQFSLQVRDPLRDFLQRALGDDDLVAVMTPEMEIDDLTFTRRTTVLAGLFDQTSAFMVRDPSAVPLGSQRLDPVEAAYQRCYGPDSPILTQMVSRRREKRTLDRLDDLAIHLGALRDERKTVLLLSNGWRLFEQTILRPPEDFRQPGPQPIPGFPRRPGPEGERDADRQLCEADRQALAGLDHRNRLNEITGNANRGNVSFYPMAPLRNPAFSGTGSLDLLATLRQLAEETDGLAIVNTNRFDEPMRRLIADTSSYYLLGYQSTNGKLDGRFRSIQVNVNRAGVTARARRGYLAARRADVIPPSSSTRTAPAIDPMVTRALGELATAAQPRSLRLRTSGWSRATGGTRETEVWVSGELDAATRRDPLWKEGGVVEVVVAGTDAVVRHSVPLAAAGGTFAMRLPDAARLGPGDHPVRVTVRPSASGSPVTEGTHVVIAADSTGLGSALLLRRGPATGIQYVQTADLRFRRTEHLRLELPTASDAPAAARILDRNGQPLQVPASVTLRSGPAPDEPAWVVVDVALAPFAAGDYAAVVTQGGDTQIVAFRIVP